MNHDDPARTSKWILLLSSLLCLGFLAASAIRENVTADWRRHQSAFRDILIRTGTGEASRKRAAEMSVEIRQVTVPALNAVDRCVSCHLGIDDPRMTKQPLPHRTHSNSLLSIHPLEKFGCTVCHQGQGAALTFEEAKGEEYFWDYPLLPPALTQASCSSCHDPRALPGGVATKLVRGMDLYLEKGCSSCHKLDGKGGQLGPVLDNVGLKTKHQFIRTSLPGSQTTWNWLAQHFRDPGGIVAGTRMPNPALTPSDVEALTVYMLSLRRRALPEEYLAPDKIEEKYARLHPPPPDGKQLYSRYCASCHDTGLYTRWAKNFQRFVPAVRNPAFLRTEDDECLATNIRDGRPGTLMPGWGPKAGGMTETEITALVKYVRGDVQPVTLPPAPARGSLQQGRTLFARNCAGCHGLDGKGPIAPSLANPVFQSSATDAFIAETIRNGREHSPMPAFARSGLTQADIADLLAYIRSWQPPVARALVPAAPTLVSALGCVSARCPPDGPTPVAPPVRAGIAPTIVSRPPRSTQ